MTFYISDFYKKFVTRNNGTSSRPLKIFNHTVDTLEVSIVDKNNQLLDIPAGQYYFVGSYRKKGNTPVFLATDFTIEEKTLKFNYSTYTYEFLNLIRGENVEIAVEIGYKDEEGEHVILQDWALASERYYVDGMPEPARVAEYYTKLQTDARIDEKVEAAIEGLVLSGYVTNEEFEEGMATKQNAITSENKLDYDLISGAPLIPAKTSELVNDSGFVTINTVDGEIENAISGKADKSEIPTEVSELTNDAGYITEQTVTESIAAHNESAEAHSTLFGNKQDKITTQSKLGYDLISGAPAIPTSTSQLVNDSGFVTEAALNGYATEAYVTGAISGKADKSEIPTAVSELTNDAEYASSGYVTNSISAHNESAEAHSTLFAAKQDAITAQSKLAYDLISGTPSIPTKTSDLQNDSGFATTGYVDSAVSGKQNTITAEAKLDYSLLSGTPTIPTAVSELTNDSGYQTAQNVTDAISGAVSGKLDISGYVEAYQMPAVRYIGDALSGAAGTIKGYFNPTANPTQQWVENDILANDRKILEVYQPLTNASHNLRFPVPSGAVQEDLSYLSGEVKTWETWVSMGGNASSFPNDFVISSIFVPTYFVKMNQDDFPTELTFPSGAYTTHVFVTRYTRFTNKAQPTAFRGTISYAGSFSGAAALWGQMPTVDTN